MKLHRHDYRTVAMEPYRDMSFGAPGVQRTRVLKRCTRCDKLKVMHEAEQSPAPRLRSVA